MSYLIETALKALIQLQTASRREEGQGTLEYIVILLGIVIIGVGVKLFGTQVMEFFRDELFNRILG